LQRVQEYLRAKGGKTLEELEAELEDDDDFEGGSIISNANGGVQIHELEDTVAAEEFMKGQEQEFMKGQEQ
jgi:hypothetical protein